MRGSEKVIEQLNAGLVSELTAIVQYMTQSEMCGNWGYPQLAARTKARAIEEMRHAEAFIERIIFFDAVPAVTTSLTPQLGASVQQQMEINLKDEQDAVVQYNKAANICRAEGDAGSEDLFKKLIQDEERHVDYLEAQLHSIQEMGIANYLAQHVKGGEES